MTPTEDFKEGTSELPQDPETAGLQSSRNNVETVLEDPYEIRIREEIAKKFSADYVSAFHCDRAFVKRGDKYFFIDRESKRINDADYDRVENFSEGVAAVANYYDGYRAKHFYVDLNGNPVGKETYTEAGSFSEGLAAVHIGENKNPHHDAEYGVGHSGNCGYIDRAGKVVIEGPFTGGGPFKNGFADVGYGFETGCKGCYGPAVIDRNGQTVADHGQNGSNRFIRLPSAKSEKLEDNYIYEDELESSQCGAYDLTGDRSLFPFLVWYGKTNYGGDDTQVAEFPLTFGKFRINNMEEAEALMEKIREQAEPYSSYPSKKSPYRGLFRLDTRDGWIMSTDQCWFSEFIYENSNSDFSEGLMAVEIEQGKWLYLSEEGKPFNEQTYCEAGPFKCGVAVVRSDSDKWTYRLINSKGEFVTEREFGYIREFADGVALAELDGKKVLIDTKGNIVFEQPHQGEEYHLTNTHGHGFGKNYVAGVNYKVEDRVYTLADDDRVYGYSEEERFSFDIVQIEAPGIVSAVLSQRDENAAIRKAREERAEVLSGGDAVLKEIYRRHLDFTKGYVQSTIMPEGTFFAVGENAWFSFYLGQVGGQKKIYAASKAYTYDGEKLIDVEEFGYTGDQEKLEGYPRRRVERSTDKAARPYCSIGSMWSDSVSGDLYCLNHVEYMVNADGAVIRKEDYEHPEEVTDPAVLISIKAQIQEDIEIRAARRALATEKSQQDPKLKEVLLAHLEFNTGHISPSVENGITFYQVGRNASHEFYLGVKDGKMYRRSVGEGDWDEEKKEYTLDSHISEVGPDGVGYVGHY